MHSNAAAGAVPDHFLAFIGGYCMRDLSGKGLRSGLLAALIALALLGCDKESPETLLGQAKADLAARNPAAAVIRLKTALQTNPSSSETRVLLGRALLQTGDARGAVVELSRALELKHDSAEVMPDLARALLQSGAAVKLTSAYGELQLDDKAAAVAFKTHLATAWAQLGKPEKAESALKDALNLDPDNPEVRLLQARMAAERGEHDKALGMVDTVIAKGAALREAWQLRGEILAFGLGNLREAEAAVRKSLDADRSYLPSHVLLTSLHIGNGDFAKAKAQFKELQELAPDQVQTVFLQAQLEMSDKNYPRALELVQGVLKVTPTNVNALRLASAIEWHLGSPEAAARLLETALKSDPTVSAMRVNLAHIYLRLGQARRAQEIIGPVVISERASSEALGVAAEASLQQGRLDQAEALFVRAASAKPEDQRLQTSLAMARLAKGDTVRALEQLENLAASSSEEFADAALVTARLRRQEFDAALAAADRLVKKAPQSAKSHELRGRVLFTQGNLAESRRAFDKALSLEPGSFPAVAALVETDFREAQPKQALQRVEAFTKATPRSHLAHLLLADVRNRAGEPVALVEEALRRAVSVAPNEPVPRVKLIELLLRQRQTTAARAAAEEAAALMPNDVGVLNALGQIQLRAGDRQQALVTLRRIVALDTNNSQAYLQLAELHRGAGDMDAAASELRRALEVDTGSREARAEFVNLFLALKRGPEAIELARTMQRREPKSPGGYLLEGDLHRRLKDHQAAAAVLKLGVSKAGESQELVFGLFASLMSLNDWKQAEHLALSWLAKNPADVLMQYAMGEGYLGRQALPAAEARFAKVVSIAPQHPAALNNLAWVLAEQGKPGASGYAKRALELSPNHPAFLDTLATALASENDVRGAIDAQRKAVELAPGDVSMRLRLAQLAVRAGDKVQAKAELGKVLAAAKAGPVRDEADRLLKGL
jgi:putative PEP-CTERM system TPR-repeat lipoprotein